ERLAAEPVGRKLSRWIKSYLQAPTRSRKGGRFATLTFAAAALGIGVGLAWGIQTGYETADRYEALVERMMSATAAPAAAGPSKKDAALSRAQVSEQIRLMGEANAVTRRYYDNHLQELRLQGRPKAEAPANP
ncbi:MAG: hypothetical protein HY293_09890, partial [Planctomycetes bacterium]|nr:hypothetical protein [Planctomycetota bacterium]